MVNAWVATRTQSLTYLRSDSPYVHVLGTLSALHVAFIALAIPVLSNFSVVCGSHCYILPGLDEFTSVESYLRYRKYPDDLYKAEKANFRRKCRKIFYTIHIHIHILVLLYI